jgi:Ca2+-transporting ATPase
MSYNAYVMDSYKRLNYYRLGVREVADQLHSSPTGLTADEARRRLEEHGLNTLKRTHHELPITTFLRQFKSLFVVILLISSALAIYLKDGKTAIILLLIAGMNAAVGYFQEHKAETLLQNLEQLLVPRAKVLRGGKLQDINSTDLVLGDVVYIESGDAVPADLRVINEAELSTNDFALTGESNPVRKFVHALSAEVPLGNRHNLVFMGTTVATGTAHGMVIGTGMHTELGRIASLSEGTKNDASPLQKEMNHLATRLTQGTFLLAVILTLIALKAQLGVHDALLFAIGIAAAMIPNGLVAEVNITLAQTASRMAKARALVKKLSAVETLGATNIILTDKTGTLTKNEMTVREIRIGKTVYDVSGTGYEANGNVLGRTGKPLAKTKLKDMSLFFAAAALASNAKVHPPDTEHATWYVMGDPTEGALITLARKGALDIEKTEATNPEIKEFQFDSARKLMSSVRTYNKQTFVFVKGAPESILARSSNIWELGHVRALGKDDRVNLNHYNETQAESAMRNLALAFRVLPKGTKLEDLKMDEVEKDLTLLGMVSMQDPLREQVPAAMHAAARAHVKVSIVTGDYPATAEAIAKQAHLSADDVTVILGEELARLADSQILQLIDRGGTVFSRVAPEDKLRIVEIAKASGRVVAVTGDGINDAPALKRADIGVAMGKTGTDVAKDAAEIVLLDDSFHTLVGAIEQGRLTFLNIRKAARCALTDNAGELIVILISLLAVTLLHIPMAITAIQILAIDIIAEMLPITALGWDKAQHRLMSDKPRKLSDHILNRASVREFVTFGLLSALLAYGNFLFYFARHGISPYFIDVTSQLYAHATILTYLTIVLCQFINLLLVRSDAHEKFFTSYLWSNKKLLIAFAISFFAVLNVIYNPLVSPYFGAGPLSVGDWLTAVVAAGIYLGVRLVQRHTRKHTRHEVIKLHREIHGRTSPAQI